MDIFDKFFKKFAYKFDKGYPDMNNSQDVLLLESLFEKLEVEVELKEDKISNKSQTIKAVQKIIDTVGTQYDLFAMKSKPNRIGSRGKQPESVFVQAFEDTFGKDIDIKVFPPKQSPNPSNSFNMYQFDTDEFGQVNIIVSRSEPGGAGKSNEAMFIDTLNRLIEEAGGTATIKITSPEYTETFSGINQVVDSSKTGAGKGDKSDAQFISGNSVKANISLKQDGGFRWASVASVYKDFIQKFIQKASNKQLEKVSLEPNPSSPNKYLMFDPTTNTRVSKVIVPDFPMEDVENWVFGPETPKVIVVGRTWKESDFSLNGDTITVQASHIYKDLADLETDEMDPVFYIAQHVGTSTGLDFRIVPSKMGNISANARELSYNEVMK
ncbi:MAG: hypothetical protein ACO239_07745 [Sediminibacterium sp.]